MLSAIRKYVVPLQKLIERLPVELTRIRVSSYILDNLDRFRFDSYIHSKRFKQLLVNRNLKSMYVLNAYCDILFEARIVVTNGFA